MKKIDFKRTLKALYAPPIGTFVDVEIPLMMFAKVDGVGDPNTTPDYALAVQSLYAVSYAMKFAAKTVLDQDYVVPPLEGLWWADDPSAFVTRSKHQWRWSMMIMVPDFVPRDMFDAAVTKAHGKIGTLPSSLRLELYDEGHALQTLHIGSYDDEGPLLAQLHDQIMPKRGLSFNGPHHEVYLSDPRKTEAAKLKTILRQPVRTKSTDLRDMA